MCLCGMVFFVVVGWLVGFDFVLVFFVCLMSLSLLVTDAIVIYNKNRDKMQML